ncbi:type IX secretion/gliding motility protein PorT/SprT [Marinoscillum pacificum]|uniref:type IX secretion/gliding motility protein PorT/SprT n=1 Tax=Marinoscillum pacificum TaxID=392723 RepID=UPI0021570F04|nr:PorT family protein [Marinoscillum pacificum]
MQAINSRNKFHIRWHQVVVLGLLFILATPAKAQNNVAENLLDYDQEWIHYGFLIGIHESKYRIQYSDAYTTDAFDTLHSIVPGALPGWKVGFVVDMALLNYLSFRVLPTVGFYEQNLTYRYRDRTSRTELKDATMVELPLMLKYKSARRGNVAMYVTGGFSPSIEASGKGDELDTRERLRLRDINMAIDAGVGFDLYFPLFKFSPEVRYSWGFRNMLTGGEPNSYDEALKKLTYQNITFYITFEGGPSYLRNRKKK